MFSRAIRLICAAFVLAALPIQSARGQHVLYAGTVNYSNGRYIFENPTHTVSTVHGLTLDLNKISVHVAFPLVYQDSPWISYSGAGPITSGGSQHGIVGGRRQGAQGRRTPIAISDPESFDRFGVGDPTFGAEYLVYESLFGNEVALVGSVKIPVAGYDSGFGTGAWDAGFGLSGTYRLYSRYLFVDLAYWSFGDMPDLELDGALSYALAIGQPFKGDRYGLMLAIGGMTRIIEDVTAPASVTIGLAQFGGSRDLSIKASFGLTESSPDISLSVGWSFQVSR